MVTVVAGVAGPVVASSEDIRQPADLNSYWQSHKSLLAHPSQIGAAVSREAKDMLKWPRNLKALPASKEKTEEPGC